MALLRANPELVLCSSVPVICLVSRSTSDNGSASGSWRVSLVMCRPSGGSGRNMLLVRDSLILFASGSRLRAPDGVGRLSSLVLVGGASRSG
jgi:hypothetical protein